MWRTRLVVRPGQKGIKNLLIKFGPRLICVRYRYNETIKKKQKTVELLLEETDWKPVRRKVYLRVELAEKKIQSMIRNAGGKWISEKGAWELPLTIANKLGLKGRIIKKK